MRASPQLIVAAMVFATIALSTHPSSAAQNAPNPFTTAAVAPGGGGPLPAFIQFDPSFQPAVDLFFPALREQYRLSADYTFDLVRAEPDLLGETHHRYQQSFKGVPVVGAEYVLHERNGRVRSANGALRAGIEGSPEPVLDESQALAAALAHIGAQTYAWQDPFWENDLKERRRDDNATYFPSGELWWLPDQVGGPETPRKYALAYRFDVQATAPHSFQRLFVDAKTGEILRTLPMESNCDAATVNTNFDGNRGISTEKYTGTNWRLRDDCTAAVIRIRNWNSTTLAPSPIEIENTTNTWTTMNERFGGSVLWATEQSYGYFLNTFARNSYDNADGDVEGYINAVFDCSPPAGCTNTDNASMSFTGGTMKVGLGIMGTLANSWSTLDIIAHEYTHAVTGSSAALTYANESGALNESFSDIFGDVIENSVIGPNDWLVGDQRTSGNIRSMSNPNAKNDPDTYLGTNWFTGTGDAGGVHTNSGVQNFWFFLLSEGGSGTNDNGWAYSFSGIGITKAAAIAYRNLTVYLTSGSTYADARNGAISAAADLYGVNSTEWQTVIQAWRAVGIDPCDVTCPSNVTASNQAGQCSAPVNYSAPTDNGLCFTVTTSPASGSVFPVGATTVTATSTSGFTCSFSVTVNDTEAPQVTCPANIVQANDKDQCGAIVTFTPTALDNCPGVTISSVPASGSFFPVGATNVLSTATDDAGNTSSCNFTVTVVDTQPPTIAVVLDKTSLWPPDHKLESILADVTVADNCPGASFVLSAITSNEPANETGDGNTAPDIMGAIPGTDDTEFLLRAERIGSGTGRDYRIVYEVTDGSGNVAMSISHVRVPISKGDAVALLGVKENAPGDGVASPARTPASPPRESLSHGTPIRTSLTGATRNPFSTSTSIGFDLARSGNVHLELFDVAGREIRTLVSSWREAGHHVVSWDGTDDAGRSVQNGVYFIRFNADGVRGQTKVLRMN